jgi:tellurite resistance protein
MDHAKMTIIRAVRDMARADGRLHQREREILRIIASAEQLSQEEKSFLMTATEPLDIEELKALLPDREDQVRLLELSVLVGMSDGVESPEEQDRLRDLTALFGLGEAEVALALERARDRFFSLSREWETEAPEA